MNGFFKQQLIQKHDTYEAIYEDTARDLQCAYEVAFFYEYGVLPDDTFVIDSVETINDQHIFIHYDPQQQH